MYNDFFILNLYTFYMLLCTSYMKKTYNSSDIE